MPVIKRTMETVSNNKKAPILGYSNINTATATHMAPVPRVKSFEVLL